MSMSVKFSAGSATPRNSTWSTDQRTRPMIMTRRGPQTSESAPDSHEPMVTIRPYTEMMTAAFVSEPAPWAARYGAMYPDSTPSPIMKSRRPTKPQIKGLGSPSFSTKP